MNSDIDLDYDLEDYSADEQCANQPINSYSNLNVISDVQIGFNNDKIELLKQKQQQLLFDSVIEKYQRIYGISDSLIFHKLNEFQWNLDRFENYMNDQHQFAFENTTQQQQLSRQDEGVCGICYDQLDYSNSESYYEDKCNHPFCSDCFYQYIQVKYGEGIQIINTKCAQPQCQEYLSFSTIEKFLDHNQYQKFRQFALQEMIKNDDLLFNCPGRDCENVYQINDPSFMELFKNKKICRSHKCSCDSYFCIICKSEAHMPLRCDLFQKFKVFTSDRGQKMSEMWLDTYTKKCPNCGTNIIKDRGCMHMTCYFCSHGFCWLCLKDCSKHGEQTGGYYDCNMYKHNEGKVSELNKNSQQLKEYEFYSERYVTYKKSYIENIQKQKKVTHNFKTLIYKKFPNEEGWIENILQMVGMCRNAIAYSYGVALYLIDKHKKDYFNMLQSDLQSKVELLDDYTDHYLKMQNYLSFYKNEYSELSEDYFKRKERSIFLTDLVQKYFTNILFQIENDLPDLDTGLVLKKQQSIYDEKLELNEYEEQEEHWTCRQCTFVNETDLDFDENDMRCQVCNSLRFQQE